jgi:phosphoglycolate phosphatase-like HAD superfamily hydrolase
VQSIGFDLDMTLVDSSPGIGDTLGVLGDEIDDPELRDAAMLDRLLRSNIDAEFEARYDDRGRAFADRFRELYVSHGVPGTTLLPGAAEAIDLVQAAGLAVIVITAKFEPNARRCLEHVGLAVDEVFGWCHGPGKAEVLRAQNAAAYIGDTEADMYAARAAGVTGIGVATGPYRADTLKAAGADVLLASLEEFPTWWATSPFVQ